MKQRIGIWIHCLVLVTVLSGCVGKVKAPSIEETVRAAPTSVLVIERDTPEINQETEIRMGTGSAAAVSESTAAAPAETEEITDTEAVVSAEPVPETAAAAGSRRENFIVGTGKTATLVFGGDVYLSNHVLSAYDKAGGIEGILDEGMRDVIDQADVFIANQEFPFSSRGKAAPDKQYTYRLAPERVSIFQEMKLDIVSLANNHALDYGRAALEDSMETLNQAGIAYIGAGNNLEEAGKTVFKDIEGMKIGFIGTTRVIPVTDWAASENRSGMLSSYEPGIATVLSVIEQAKTQCDYLVVYVHWGAERAEYPASYQRTLGQKYIDAGADLVVGSHPHVLQGIEYYHGKPIVYSLGNLMFGSSIPKTALLQVEVINQQDGLQARMSLVPGTASKGYTRKLTDADETTKFYQYIEKLSQGITVSEAGEVSESQ